LPQAIVTSIRYFVASDGWRFRHAAQHRPANPLRRRKTLTCFSRHCLLRCDKKLYRHSVYWMKNTFLISVLRICDSRFSLLTWRFFDPAQIRAGTKL
jgi:hypothetical protein